MINVLAPGANVALFRVDKLAILFAVIFGIAGIITFIYSHKLRSIRETLIEIFYAVCSIGIVFANDWITMVICWEMMAVCSWFITNEVRTPQGVGRKNVYAVERQFLQLLFYIRIINAIPILIIVSLFELP